METASKKKPVKQPSKTKPTKAEKPVYTFDDTKNNTSSKAAKEAIRELRDAEMRRKMGERYDEIVGKPEMAKGGAVQKKMSKVMGEYKAGTLRSGGTGKAVKNPKQAVAIGLSEARRLKK
jgi:ribosome-binding protein aMBF1 (putative translation factor)